MAPAQKARALLVRGLALTYVAFVLLLPLAVMVWYTSQRPLGELLPVITHPVAIASYQLTFGSAITLG